MRTKKTLSNLSRRERQIMDVLYRDGQATAGEVLAALPDPRATRRSGRCSGSSRTRVTSATSPRAPATSTCRRCPRDRAGRPALASVIETFFDGSTEKAVAALLDISKTELSGDQLDRLSQLIDQARMEGR